MKLVVIDWHDAYGGIREGWRSLDEIKDRNPSRGRSVGYLIRETEDVVVVVPHLMGTEDANGPMEEGDGEIAIPRSWIKAHHTIAGFDVEI